MRRYGPWLAAALVVVSNLAAWRVAALNRSGEPEAVLVLTERELRLPVRQAENTGLTLLLVFEPPKPRSDGAPREPGWFDRAKLQSIGFDCRRPVAKEHGAYYRTRPPRTTFAALEYAETASPGSRLHAIDVDNDAAALRRRHPDRRRVTIVEATAVMQFVANDGQPPFLMGRVTSVLPSEIHVPREWRGLLTPLQSSERATTWPPPDREPRFRATIAWGKRLEPWITSVELLTSGPASSSGQAGGRRPGHPHPAADGSASWSLMWHAGPPPAARNPGGVVLQTGGQHAAPIRCSHALVPARRRRP